MLFDDFCHFMEDPTSLERLGKLPPEILEQYFVWLSLVRRDYLSTRLLSSEWAQHCRHTGEDPYFLRICQLVLYGHLASLSTRDEPNPLYHFWKWALPPTGLSSQIYDLWTARDVRIRASLTPASSLGDVSMIAVQEHNYAHLLLECKSLLDNFPRQLGWASRAIQRVVVQREAVINERSDRAFCRLVFEWINKPSHILRDALVLRFTLGAQLPDAKSEPLIEHPELYTERFLDTLRVVADATRRRRFHTLALHTSIETRPERVLPPEQLDGASGGAALLLSQALANTTSRTTPGMNFTLYPWMTSTCVLNDETRTLTPATGIKAKLAALNDDGVRVIFVAPDNAHVEDVARRAYSGQLVLPINQPIPELARELVMHKWAAPADLRGLKKLGTPRKQYIAIALLLVGLLSSSLWAWQSARHHRFHSTTAMSVHDEKALSAVANEYLTNRRQFTPDSDYGPLTRALPKEPYKGFRVHEISLVWDSFYWKEVANPQELHTRPIEPALSTIVFTVERDSDDVTEFVRQLNTTGMGVHYIEPHEGEIPFSRPPEWRMKPLLEAPVPTRTYLTSYDVSTQPVGKKFQIVERCVVFNPTQDQTCRSKPTDWWGLRVPPGVGRADIAVRLPASRRYYSPRKKMRDASRDEEWTDAPNPTFEHAGEEVGSYSLEDWFLWRIPTKHVDVTTIFSIHWQWSIDD